MKKYWKLIACMLVLTVLIAGCGEKVVAKVNGEKITEKEFNTRIEQYIISQGFDLESEAGKNFKEDEQENFLQNLINEKLLLQGAREKKISVNEKEFEAGLKEFKAQFSSEKAFEEWCKTAKYTKKDFEDTFRKSLLVEKLYKEVTKDISAPSIDPQNYYNENKGMFIMPETVDVRHILVNTEKEAKDIIKLLDNGEDFTKLVSEKSLDPSAKQNQGLIENVSMASNFYEEFKAGAFALKEVGKYTKEPVKSQAGYHIIKLESREKQKQLTYDEVKDNLSQYLLNQDKEKKFEAYLTELQKNAKIEKSLPEKKEQKADEKADGKKDSQDNAETKDSTSESNGKTESGQSK